MMVATALPREVEDADGLVRAPSAAVCDTLCDMLQRLTIYVLTGGTMARCSTGVE